MRAAAKLDVRDSRRAAKSKRLSVVEFKKAAFGATAAITGDETTSALVASPDLAFDFDWQVARDRRRTVRVLSE